MIQIYLTPIFWAIMISTVLRKPRNSAVAWLSRFVPDQDEGSRTINKHPMEIIRHVFFYMWLNGLKRYYTVLVKLLSVVDGRWIQLLLGAVFINALIIFKFNTSILVILAIDLSVVVIIMFVAFLLTTINVRTLVAIVFSVTSLLSFIVVVAFFAIMCTQEITEFFSQLQQIIQNQNQNLNNILANWSINQTMVNTWITGLQDWSKKQKVFYNDTAPPLMNVFDSFESWLQNFENFEFNNNNLYDKINTFELNQVMSISQKILRAFSATTYEVIMRAITSVMSIFLVSVDYIVALFIFTAVLYYMLKLDLNEMGTLERLFPPEMTTGLSKKFSKHVTGIFLSTFWKTIVVCLVTGVWYWSLTNFLFIPILFAALLTIFPLLPAYTVFLPLVIHLCYIDNYSLAIVSAILGVSIITGVESFFLAWIPNAGHPYVTGLSIAMGLYTFSFNGIILGPLLVFMTMIVFDTLFPSSPYSFGFSTSPLPPHKKSKSKLSKKTE
eukprot:TRINITY_DN5429_c1_g1_i1.p1 TRINITY_DN5429_c1_g1~~TRINITY_DN5429_c1_g1_i1.p1  ORF type:complete len:583 (+),score=92.95 TRINITY_DN5429_c1_g1_i1:260-1750(+)